MLEVLCGFPFEPIEFVCLDVTSLQWLILSSLLDQRYTNLLRFDSSTPIWKSVYTTFLYIRPLVIHYIHVTSIVAEPRPDQL